MRRRAHAQVGVALLLGILFIGIISAIMLIPALVGTVRPVAGVNTELATVTPTASA